MLEKREISNNNKEIVQRPKLFLKFRPLGKGILPQDKET